MKEDWKQRLNCMKHIATYFLKIVVGLFFVICIFQQEGYALSFTSGNIKYETNADGTSVSVIENRSSSAMVVRSLYSGDISIPANVTYSGKTYKVTEIGADAFQNAPNLTSISFPSTIRKFNSNCFKSTYVPTVGIPDIEWWLNMEVSGIYASPFTYKMTKLMVGGKETTELVIPDGTKEIPAWRFASFASIKSIKLPSSLTKIGDYSMQGMPLVTELEIGPNVTYIGNAAFRYYDSLKTLVLDCGIIGINSDCFRECDGLEKVIIKPHPSVDKFYIDKSAFYNCKSLKDVVLPNNLSGIGNQSFAYCTSLESLNVPQNVTSIKEEAFKDCKALKSVIFEGISASSTLQIDDTAFGGSGIVNIGLNRTIEGASFKNCETLETVTIGNGAIEIPESCFEGCINLADVSIAKCVMKIGSRAFYNCGKLSVNLGDTGIETIGGQAFYNCQNLSSDLVFPSTIKEIGDDAFKMVKTIKTVEFLPGSDVVTIKTNNPNSNTHLFGSSVLETVKIGRDIQYYDGCSPWGSQKSLTTVVLSEGVTQLGESCFSGCSALESISLPSTLVSIGRYCFGQTGIKELTIPESVSRVDMGFVRYAAKLTNIYAFCGGQAFTSTSFDNCGKSVILWGVPTNYINLRDSYSALVKVGMYGYGIISDEIVKMGSYSFNVSPMTGVDLTQVNYLIGNKLDGSTIGCSAGVTEFMGLTPSTTYDLKIFFDYGAHHYEYIIPFKTLDAKIVANLLSSTQTTLTIGVSSDNDGSYKVQEYGFIYGDKKYKYSGDGIKLDKLKVNTSYKVIPYMKVNGYVLNGNSISLKTESIYINISESNKYPTTMTVMATWNAGDAKVDKFYFTYAGKDYNDINNIQVSGLDPNTSYTLRFSVVSDGVVIQSSRSFKTSDLVLVTNPSETISDNCAIISAKTNISDYETGTGFEWRRYDAPEEMPSVQAPCRAVNGSLAGKLNGLSKSTYYKFRPFYKSASEKFYYGEWVAFITADAYVYFEPLVYCYAPTDISGNAVVLTGYIVPGSEQILKCGFQYKLVDAVEWITVECSSDDMSTKIYNLLPNVEYEFRMFVETSKEITYSQKDTFHTLNVSGIDSVTLIDENIDLKIKNSNELSVKINGGGDIAEMFIFDMTGCLEQSCTVLADGNWHDVEINGGNNGMKLLLITTNQGRYSKKILFK